MKTRKKEEAERKKEYYKKNHIGDELGFEASEAYKLLRTNLTFSLPDADRFVVGVTSSLRGEGKSTTAVNLAYSLAQAGKKVVIMELDMRLPTVSEHFPIKESPGVSNLLVRTATEEEVTQPSGIIENLNIITAGDIPPNPSELLGSDRMPAVLEKLKSRYDCIIMDLPPVNIVSDALIVSKYLDGIILVVRQDYSRRKELNEALRQLGIANAKILGFALNDSSPAEKKYRNKYGYRKYGYKYGYKKYGSYSRYGYSGYGYDDYSYNYERRKHHSDLTDSKKSERKNTISLKKLSLSRKKKNSDGKDAYE